MYSILSVIVLYRLHVFKVILLSSLHDCYWYLYSYSCYIGIFVFWHIFTIVYIYIPIIKTSIFFNKKSWKSLFVSCFIFDSKMKHFPGDTFYQHDLILSPTCINNYTHYKVWNEIIYPFRNFKCAAVQVWEWINYFTPHFSGHVFTYSFNLRVNCGTGQYISMVQCKTAVSPLLTHGSYCSLALSHRYHHVVWDVTYVYLHHVRCVK